MKYVTLYVLLFIHIATAWSAIGWHGKVVLILPTISRTKSLVSISHASSTLTILGLQWTKPQYKAFFGRIGSSYRRRSKHRKWSSSILKKYPKLLCCVAHCKIHRSRAPKANELFSKGEEICKKLVFPSFPPLFLSTLSFHFLHCPSSYPSILLSPKLSLVTLYYPL